MHSKYQNNFTLSGLSSTIVPKKNKQNQNFPVQQHKTQRKSSLGARAALTDLPLNHIEFTHSNSKPQKTSIPRPASIDAHKAAYVASNNQPSMMNTRWLDSQKEMMEFILNLKSKKSESKYRSSKAKKTTEGFQLQESQVDKKELLCNRMLLMKKIQKHEKEAISSFYEKDYNKCFGELQKAENIIKKEQINSPEHQLYINYLHAQFYYKLEVFDKWKIFLQKAKNSIGKVSIGDNCQMREYVMNVRALDVCFHLYLEKYDKVLTLVDELREEEFLSSKIRRRISSSQITALKKLYRYQDAINAIELESHAIETDPEMSSDKKEAEFAKLFEQKIEITAEFISVDEAIRMVEYLLNFEEVSSGLKNSFSHYNSKIYLTFASLLKKTQDKLKLLYFYEKWLQIEPNKKEKLKIELQLFSIYYQMGIYQKALELFDEISSQNVVYLGPQYLVMFANIKHFNGDEKEAISIITKSIDISQNECEKALYMYRLLELDLEAEGIDRGEREMALENYLRCCEKENVEHIAELYMEYLQGRYEKERCMYFGSRWKQTACFNQNHKSGRKVSSKR